MTNSAIQEFNNIAQLFEASDCAVKAGVDYLLITINKKGKIELKGTPSMVTSLSANKQLLKGLRVNLWEKQKW